MQEIITKQNGNMKEIAICGIYCISNSKYFYVGLSKNIRKRWNLHKNHLRKGIHDNPFMQNVYNKYNIEDPFAFTVVLECEPKDLATLEKQVFDEYCVKYDKKIPMNLAECGASPKWSESSKLKASITHTGRRNSKEHRKAISEGQKGLIRKNQRIKIVQLTLDGQFIKLWDSRKEIEQEMGYINLKRKSSKGFQWQHYEEWLISPKGPVEYKKMKKEILQYSMTGGFIRKYDSVQEASDITGIRQGTISNCLTGRLKYAGGFIWKYQK